MKIKLECSHDWSDYRKAILLRWNVDFIVKMAFTSRARVSAMSHTDSTM